MTRRWIAIGVAAIAALAVTAAPALSGGAISKQKSPTAAQKRAIMKAAKFKGPARCYTVQLSARTQTIAGAKFNRRASNCRKYAFDGAAIYYAPRSKKVWYLLQSGSALDGNECDAVQVLIGGAAWQDMIPYIETMGCRNFD
jgi:hypothetical protein